MGTSLMLNDLYVNAMTKPFDGKFDLWLICGSQIVIAFKVKRHKYRPTTQNLSGIKTYGEHSSSDLSYIRSLFINNSQ